MAKWIQKYFTLVTSLVKNLFLCSLKQVRYNQVVTVAKVIILKTLPCSNSKEVVPIRDFYKHQDNDSEAGLYLKVTIISVGFEFSTNVKNNFKKSDQWLKRAKRNIGAVIVSFLGSYLVYIITRQ